MLLIRTILIFYSIVRRKPDNGAALIVRLIGSTKGSFARPSRARRLSCATCTDTSGAPLFVAFSGAVYADADGGTLVDGAATGCIIAMCACGTASTDGGVTLIVRRVGVGVEVLIEMVAGLMGSEYAD